MRQCIICKQKWPNHLVQDMAIGDEKGLRYIATDPICALEKMNEIHGMSRTKFDGKMAEALRLEAVAYKAKRDKETAQ